MQKMLCSLLFTVVIVLSHNVKCESEAEADVALTPGIYTRFERDWRIKGSNIVLRYQTEFNRHHQFHYLTYDKTKTYCDVTQVPTDSSKSESLTCQYNFKSPDDKEIYIYRLIVPNNEQKTDWTFFSWSSADSRSKNRYVISTMNFTKCRDNKLAKSEVEKAETDADENTVEIVENEMSQSNKATGNNFTSEANGKKGVCIVNEELTEATCSQFDADGKKILDEVKYKLPHWWKAEWFSIYNLKDAAILFVFSSCPNGMCADMSFVKITGDGKVPSRYRARLSNVECHDVKSDLHVDIAEVPDKKYACIHMVCANGLYKKSSEERVEVNLQYRKSCIGGTPIYEN